MWFFDTKNTRSVPGPGCVPRRQLAEGRTVPPGINYPPPMYTWPSYFKVDIPKYIQHWHMNYSGFLQNRNTSKKGNAPEATSHKSNPKQTPSQQNTSQQGNPEQNTSQKKRERPPLSPSAKLIDATAYNLYKKNYPDAGEGPGWAGSFGGPSGSSSGAGSGGGSW